METFERKVLEIVSKIPHGKVTTYGHIARAAGSGHAARMVGWILNRQKFNPRFPVHRVVNRHGELTGRLHFETPDLMRQLLENEGIRIENNRIVNLEKYLWIPTFF